MLREYLGTMEVSYAAAKLRISRSTLSRIVNAKVGISADMSLRLSEALGTHAAFWFGRQLDSNLRQAARRRRVKIAPFTNAA